MESLEICRICLQVEVRMHLMVGTQLQEVYDKLIDPSTATDLKSKYVCYICHAQLRNCLHLYKRAQNADCIFNLLLQTNDEITIDSVKETANPFAHNYCAKLLDDPIELREIKVELEPKTEDGSKEEFVIKNEFGNDFAEDNHSSTDSELDVPLNDIKKRQCINNESVEVRKKKRSREVIKVNAKKILLSHSEQLAEMLKRAQSDNYINAPYKCELCYKGYIDSNAFANHQEKHSESCGAWQCSLCKMRYRSARHLRTHTNSSHARRFACNRCQYVAHTASQARDHEKWHNGWKYECQICSHQFSKPTSYLSHMRKAHPSTHACDACGESFLGEHGLLMHYKKAHKHTVQANESEPASDRFCSPCGVQFLSVTAWKRHAIVKHYDRDSPHCPICKQAVDDMTMSSHMRRHASELRDDTVSKRVMSPASCEQCGGKFANKYKLQAHVRRMHLGIKYNKNIMCEVCGKSCTASLSAHARIHSDSRPYACPSCPSRFRDANQLRLHSRTHSGERPYSCDACSLSFTQRPALTRHHRVHTGAKPYVCQFCSRAFTQSSSLKLHVNTVHLKIPPKRRRNKLKNGTDSDHEQNRVVNV